MPRHHDIRWPVEDGPDDQSDADDTLQSGGAVDTPNTDTCIRSQVFTEPEPENRRPRRRRVQFAFNENQLPPRHINPKNLAPSGTDRPEGRSDTEFIVTQLVMHIDLPDTSKANPAMTRTVLTIIGGLPGILAP